MSFQIHIRNYHTCECSSAMNGKDVLSKADIDGGSHIVAWRVNSYLRPLGWVVDDEAEVEFVDTSSFEGMEVYRRSLSFSLVLAAQRALGKNVTIKHSISDGYYWELPDRDLTEEEVLRINKALRDLVNRDVPITREVVPLDKARRIFERQGNPESARLFMWAAEDPVELYRCEDNYGFYYAPLAPSTGYLRVFELKYFPPGMVLQFPTVSYPDRLPPFRASKKLSGVFLDYAKWLEILGLKTMDSFHAKIAQGKGLELVLISEAFHSQRLSRIAEDIALREKTKVIVIAGPSGSGKTTTAKRLKIQLQVCGLNPTVISLDNYFVDRERTPLDEQGNYDFEVLEAIDLDLLESQLAKLLKGEEVRVPEFDFIKGKKFPGATLRLNKHDVLIIEGIHGLNEKVTAVVPEEMKFGIFVSPLTGINLDEHNRTSTTDNRLLRRMIRDYRTRGHSAERTLDLWPSVIKGAREYIFPYQSSAVAMFNSSLPYELAVLRGYAQPLLQTVPESSSMHGEARRLLSMLKFVPPLSSENVPSNSILREFIGGGCYEH